MVDNLESTYNSMYSQLQKVNPSRLLTNPSGNVFRDRHSTTNAITASFGPLNRILVSMGMVAVPIAGWIEDLRDPAIRGNLEVKILAEANDRFETEKGKCTQRILKKLEQLRELG